MIKSQALTYSSPQTSAVLSIWNTRSSGYFEIYSRLAQTVTMLLSYRTQN